MKHPLGTFTDAVNPSFIELFAMWLRVGRLKTLRYLVTHRHEITFLHEALNNDFPREKMKRFISLDE